MGPLLPAGFHLKDALWHPGSKVPGFRAIRSQVVQLPGIVLPLDQFPANGIYILFEEGEQAHGMKRIVRIGTHTGNNQLRPRLSQHFINERKDRSIFSKNIGRCLLNKNNDPFLEDWQRDLTTRAAKEQWADKIDFAKQAEIENQVSDAKQCGHQDGKVTVPREDFIEKLRACRLAFEELGVDDGVIVDVHRGGHRVVPGGLAPPRMHVVEQHANNRIIRPDHRYTGPQSRPFKKLSGRH